MSRLRRELGNSGPPDKKFKLDILSKNTSNDDIIGPNRLINIEDMNTVFNAKSLCSKCRCNTLQLRDVFFIGAAHNVSISCTKCSSNANTIDLKQDDFNYSTSHYYNSNEIDDSVIVPRRTNSAGNSDIYRKICSYETNIQLMLLTIYLGKSGRATASIAGALGFPKPSAMVKSFHRHADTVGKTIRSAVESIEEENLQLEILATLNGRNDGITYDHTIFLSNGKLRSDVPPVGLHTSYDMGWQKRSSGRRYDSPSGHGLLVGQKNKSVLCHKVFSKWCRTCDMERENGERVPDHICPKNYGGKSSKSMEADAALNMFKHLYETYDNKVYIEQFISDDDSSTRNLLCHPTEHKNGALSLDMASPTFLCDVGHRIKCMAKPFFSLANLSNRLWTCTKSDALLL